METHPDDNAMKTKCTVISSDRNIGVRFFPLAQMIGWWHDTDSFMDGNICILELINYMQNPSSEFIQRHDRNVGSEGFRMCHCTVELVKTNNLNLRTHFFTVVCNKFPCYRIVAFLNTCINE